MKEIQKAQNPADSMVQDHARIQEVERGPGKERLKQQEIAKIQGIERQMVSEMLSKSEWGEAGKYLRQRKMDLDDVVVCFAMARRTLQLNDMPAWDSQCESLLSDHKANPLVKRYRGYIVDPGLLDFESKKLLKKYGAGQ